jgi:hypothetical protein
MLSSRGQCGVFEAWFLLVQCADWLEVANQLLVSARPQDCGPLLWLLTFYHHPTNRGHHRTQQLVCTGWLDGKGSFLILGCSPSPSALRTALICWAWTIQGVESIPQGCRAMLTPQLCQVGWMSFGWWTILDTHRKNSAALQFLTQTGAPGTYCHTPFKGTLNLLPSLNCLNA